MMRYSLYVQISRYLCQVRGKVFQPRQGPGRWIYRQTRGTQVRILRWRLHQAVARRF